MSENMTVRHMLNQKCRTSALLTVSLRQHGFQFALLQNACIHLRSHQEWAYKLHSFTPQRHKLHLKFPVSAALSNEVSR